jgi:hypothetical protein
MITGILIISYLAAAAALGDQLRRPASAWVAADRNRGWWIATTTVFGLFACGIVIAPAYLLGVVPRFGNHLAVDDAFRKR